MGCRGGGESRILNQEILWIISGEAQLFESFGGPATYGSVGLLTFLF